MKLGKRVGALGLAAALAAAFVALRPAPPPKSFAPTTSTSAVDVAAPFSSDGFRVSDAVRVRLKDIRIGDRPLLPPDRLRGVEPRVEAGAAVYDRGAVVEKYLPRGAAHEQIFVLDASLEPRKGEGDLVVTVELDATDPPALAEDVVRLGGGLAIGPATAIDASGRAWPMAYALDGRALEMRLGARELSQAAFPLTVDPVIGSEESLAGHELAELAHIPGAPLGLHLTEGFYGDVSAQPFTFGGDPYSGHQYVSPSQEESRFPRAAGGVNNLYLAVWQLKWGAGWAVAGRILRLDPNPSYVYTPQVYFASPRLLIATGGDDSRPDVGWCASTGSWLVAWQRAGDIYGATVSTSGATGSPFAIAATPDAETLPSVGARFAGPVGVAWTRLGNVYACAVSVPTSSATAAVLLGPGSEADLSPELSGGMAYASWTQGNDVVACRATFGAGGVTPGSPFLVGAGSESRAWAVSRPGTSRLIVVHARNPTAPPTLNGHDVYASVFDAAADPPTLVESARVDANALDDRRPLVAADADSMSAWVSWRKSSTFSTSAASRQFALVSQPSIYVDSDAIATAQASSTSSTRGVRILNAGTGTLSWTASSNQPWLTFAPGNGSSPSAGSSSLGVVINTAGLAAGDYAATVTLTSGGAINSPRTLAVNLRVVAITWVTPPAGPYTGGQPINVSWSLNAGTATTTDHQVYYTSFPNTPNTGSNGSGQQPGGSGIYSATLQAPTVGSTSTWSYAPIAKIDGAYVSGPVVNAVINPATAPVIGSFSPLTFAAARGGPNPTSASLELYNTGTGTLAWSGSASVPWLRVSPPSGSLAAAAHQPFVVSADVAGLAAGVHTGSVLITAPGAANSPKSVPVTLTVVGVDWITPPAASYLSGDVISARWSVTGGAIQFSSIGLRSSTQNPPYGTGASQYGSSGVYDGFFVAPAVTSPTTYFLAPYVAYNPDATGPAVAVLILPPANLKVTPNSLSFGAAGAQTLNVLNTGAGALAFTASSDVPWLTVDPAGGSAPQAVTATADPAGLPAGGHRGTVTVTSGGTVRTVPVTMELSSIAWTSPPPASAVGGQPIPAGWSVAAGDLPISQNQVLWSTSNPPTGGASTPDQPGAGGSFTASIQAPVVAVSTTYYFQARARIGGTTQTTSVVAVTIDPPAGPVATLTTSVAMRGPTTTYALLTNEGPGLLTWTASDNVPWLTLNPTSGALAAGASEYIALTSDVASLAQGTYNGLVTVSGASNSPKTMPVALEVEAPPALTVTPSSLAFYVGRGGAPITKYPAVKNTGAGTLHWSVSSDQPWLRTQWGGGSTSAGSSNSFYAIADPGTRPAGVYTGTLTVSAPGALGSPATVAVTMTVVEVAWTVLPAATYTAGQAITLGWSVQPAGLTLEQNRVYWGENPTSSSEMTDQPGPSGVFSVTRPAPRYSVPTTYYLRPAVKIQDQYEYVQGPILTTALLPPAGPVIELDSSKQWFYKDLNGPAPTSRLVRVYNGGTGTVNWSVAPDVGWLGVSPATGTAPAGTSGQYVTLTVNAAGLPVGTHQGNLVFTAPGATNSPLTLPVEFRVMSIAWTSPLAASYVVGDTIPFAWTVNAGAGTFTSRVYYDTSNPPSYGLLYQSGPSGPFSSSMTAPLVSVPTTYYFRAEFQYGVSVYSSVRSTVIQPAGSPGIGLPASLTFRAARGGSDPPSQTFTLSNTGATSLVWSLADDAAWLGVTPTSGTLNTGASQTLTATVDVDGLPAGGHPATITVTAPGASNSPRALPVTFNVIGLDWVTPPPAAAVSGQAIPFSWSLAAGTHVMLANRVLAGTSVPGFGLSSTDQPGPSGTYTGKLWAPSVSSPTVYYFNPAASDGVTSYLGPSLPVTVHPSGASTSPNTLYLFPSSLSFLMPEGGATPQPQLVQSYGYIYGSFTGSSDVPWITVTSFPYYPAVSIAVNPAGLASGTHTGKVTVTTPGGETGTVPVTLTVASIGWVAPPAAGHVGGDRMPLVWRLTSGSVPTSSHKVYFGLTNPPWADASGASQGGSGGLYAGSVQTPTVAAPTTCYFGVRAMFGTVAVDSPVVGVEILPPTGPVIGVDATELLFEGHVGGANPPAQILNVSNAGIGTLAWTLSDDAAWLAGTPPSGALAAGASAPASIAVNTASLAAGDYAATLSIADPAAVNSPQTVRVRLILRPGEPVIAAAPSNLSFTMAETGPNPAAKTLTLTNTGGGTLAWSAVDNAAWLSVAPASGSLGPGASQDLTVTSDGAGLSAASYAASITISAAGAVNTPQTVSATFHVLPPAPILEVTPEYGTSLEAAVGGPALAPFALTVRNAGAPTLNWTATSSASWLSVDTSGGALGSGGTSILNVTADPAGLAPGTYTGTIRVADPASTSLPALRTFTLTVKSATATISLSSTSISFVSAPAGPAPTDRTLVFYNTGGVPLNWTAADDAAWLSVSPAAGSLAPGSQAAPSVLVDPAGLAPGRYTATITLADPAASNSPKTAAVTLLVAELAWIQPPQAGPYLSGQSIPVSWELKAGARVATENDVHIATYYPPSVSDAGQGNQPGSSGIYAADLFAPIVTAPLDMNFMPHAVVDGLHVVGPVRTLRILPPTSGVVAFSVESLQFTAQAGGAAPVSRTVTLSNPGTAPLSWTATDAAAWLAFSPASGSLAPGGSQTLTVWADPAGLAAGAYPGAITVTAPGAVASPRPLPVHLTVGTVSWITPPPASLAAGQTFTVSWELAIGARPTTSNWIASGWMLPLTSSSTGSQPGSSGVYTTTLTATSPATSPQPVFYQPQAIVDGTKIVGPVAETVVQPTPPSPPGISPTSLVFVASAGGTNPWSQSASIYRGPNMSFSWTATESAAWLSLSPTSGTGYQSASTSVQVDVAGLAAGTYTHTINVDAGGVALSLPVTLHVVGVTWTSTPPAGVESGQPVTFGWTLSMGSAVAQVHELRRNDASYAVGLPQPGVSGAYAVATTAPMVAVSTTFTYYVSLRVGQTSFSLSPIAVTVEPGPPKLEVTSAAPVFSAGPGEAVASLNPEIVVRNAAGGLLFWDASESVPWLSLATSSGSLTPGASQSIGLSVDPAGLAAGTHYGAVTLSGPGATDSPKTVWVALHVVDIAWIDPLAASYRRGEDILFRWRFDAGGAPAAAGVQWSTDGVSWSWSPTYMATSGTRTESWPVPSWTLPKLYYFRPAVGLNFSYAATYYGPVVTTMILPGPSFSLSPTSIAFTNATPQTVTLTNTGQVALSWTASSSVGWLGVSASGTTGIAGTSTLTLTPNLAGLAPGTYPATITVTGSGGSGYRTVAVTLTVGADAAGPRVTRVSSNTPDGPYGRGRSIGVTLHFSEPVTLAGGSLRIALDSGGMAEIAPFGPA
ncbi:MAG TPA: BACON domain-containing carbohydrate-binding protein, partial [Planctomycetota bacterium]